MWPFEKWTANLAFRLRPKADILTLYPQDGMREFLIRGLYCEMLGYPVPFVYIHALNMTQSQRLLDKRVGYLCTSMFLHDDHELLLLLLNSVRKDLDSTNILEVSAGLSCMSWLLNRETVSAILPLIIEKTKSQNELVRKKAVILLMRCLEKDVSTTWDEIENVLRARLCDMDPSVMATTLHCFSHVIKLKLSDPLAYSFLPTLSDLVPSFVGILKQLVEKRLPPHFDYHKVHGPWIQISLLRLLRNIGLLDANCVTHMSQVLKLILTTPADKMIACAIVNEAIQTICALGGHVEKDLLDLSARNITLFLGATSQDLNYLGLTLLAKLVTINPVYAAEHQAHVISCLESPDETIRRKTIELLFHMTNPRNMPVIVSKMLERLKKSAPDSHMRAELVIKITTLAEKFSTDNYWFITTMNDVFLTAGSQVPMQVAHRFIRYIAEGATDDEETNIDLRIHAVTAHLQLVSEPQLSEIMQMVMAWVIGEYGYLLENPEEALDALTDLLERPPASRVNAASTAVAPHFIGSTDSKTYSFLPNDSITLYHGTEVKQWIISALAKLVASSGLFPSHVRDCFLALRGSDNLELSRKSQDLLQILDEARASDSVGISANSSAIPTQDLLIGDAPLASMSLPTQPKRKLDDIFPKDSSTEDLVPSVVLGSKLDAIVNSALAKGARPYSKPAVEKLYLQTKAPKEDKALRWKAYERPTEPSRAQIAHNMHHLANPNLATGAFSTQPQAYNPMMTTVGGASSPAPASPLATNTAPHLQTTQPPSLASLGTKAGPWSSSGFGGRSTPTTQQPIPSHPQGHPFTPPVNTSSKNDHLTTTLSSQQQQQAHLSSTRPELDSYKPKMDANQERLANALFSGVGDLSSPTGSPLSTNVLGTNSPYATTTGGAGRKRPVASTRHQTKAHDAPTSPVATNLIDFPSGAPETHSNTSTTGSADLLGMDMSFSTTSNPTSPHMTPSGSLLDGLNIEAPRQVVSTPEPDLLGGILSHTPSPTPSRSPSLNVMSFTEASSSQSSAANGGQVQQLIADKDNWNLSNFSRSPLITAQLESFPKPSHTSQMLSSDSFLAVASIKAWTSRGITVGLFFGNRTTVKTDKVSSVLNLSHPLRSHVEVDNTTSIRSLSLDGTSIELFTPEISPHAAVVVAILIHVEDKLSLNMSLSGTTSFEVHGQPKSVKYRIPIDLRDLIRPTPSPSSNIASVSNVNQFGASWTNPEMREARTNSSASTAAMFASTTELASSLSGHNFAIIQAGKSELVAVCYSLITPSKKTAGDASAAALLHAKLDANAKAIEWTLKSESQSFAEIASRYISAAYP